MSAALRNIWRFTWGGVAAQAGKAVCAACLLLGEEEEQSTGRTNRDGCLDFFQRGRCSVVDDFSSGGIDDVEGLVCEDILTVDLKGDGEHCELPMSST